MAVVSFWVRLSQIAEARRYLDSYDSVGKTVVLPGPVGTRGRNVFSFTEPS